MTRDGSGDDARQAALDVVRAVVRDRRSLDVALPRRISGLEDPRERSLASELSYGVLRWLPRLQAAIAMLVDRPLKARDRDLPLVLAIGLHQVLHLRTPPHAAVSASVDLARTAGLGRAAGLVNAVLRRALRERDSLEARLNRNEEARFAHPAWVVDAVRGDWPDAFETVLDANNARAPMTLRINARRTSRRQVHESLTACGIEAHETRWSPLGLQLGAPHEVDDLPGFSAGLVSVQDQAAQFAAPALGARRGERVLDACAAPGGKTAHLLEYTPDLDEVVAVERAPARAERLRATLARLDLPATVIEGDAANPDSWWDGRPFDRVLLDAPCSATGVARRHPDVKVLRRAGDPARLAERQYALLDALWKLLIPGGRLLYATCSVLARENDLVVERFLAEQSDARSLRVAGRWGRRTARGRQILPGEDAMDGFYYAAISRAP